MEIVKAGKWRAALVVLIFLSAGYGVGAYVNHTSILQYDSFLANLWVNSTSTKSTNYYVGTQTLHDYILATAPGGTVNGTAIDVTSIDSSSYTLNDVSLNARLGGNYGALDITTTGDVKGTNVNATTEFYRGGTSLTNLLAGIAGGQGVNVTESSYIVYKDGSTYYAQNGFTGLVDYSGATASTVINSALGALTGGRTWKEKVVIKGLITLTDGLTPDSYTVIEIQGKLDWTSTAASKKIISATSKSYIDIIGGEIDGNSGTDHDCFGVWLTSCSHCLVDGVYVHDISGTSSYGMHFITCSFCDIKNCRVEHCKHSGICVTCSTDCNMIDCKAYDVPSQAGGGGSAAFTVLGASGTHSYRCNIINSNCIGIDPTITCGVQIYNYCNDCHIIGGTYFNTQGVYLGNSGYINTCTGLSCMGATINGNSAAVAGIVLYDSDTTVVGNTVNHIVGVGIQTYAAVNTCTIVGNTITDITGNYHIGILIRGSWCTIEGNTIRNTYQGIQLETGATYNRLMGNTIHTVSDIGIYLPSGANYNNIFGNSIYSDNATITDSGTGNVSADNREVTY